MSYRMPNTPTWNKELRVCCRCKITDAPVYSGEATEKGEAIFLHTVTVDFMKLKERRQPTKREQEMGWEMMPTPIDGGDYYLVRSICRECVTLYDEEQEIWKDFDRQRERDQREGQPETFWSILCS